MCLFYLRKIIVKNKLTFLPFLELPLTSLTVTFDAVTSRLCLCFILKGLKNTETSKREYYFRNIISNIFKLSLVFKIKLEKST